MIDALNALGGLVWTLIVETFNLYKALIGVRNDVLAVALGVSPFMAGLIWFALSKIKKALS